MIRDLLDQAVCLIYKDRIASFVGGKIVAIL